MVHHFIAMRWARIDTEDDGLYGKVYELDLALLLNGMWGFCVYFILNPVHCKRGQLEAMEWLKRSIR
jgi:hypothetical protein